MRKVFLFLLLPVSVASQRNDSALLSQFMTGQHEYFRFNGNVLVARQGKPIYQQALGYADYNTKRTLNDSSVFELASVSKQFTAMGIMILKEKGLLSYTDDLKKFFPDLPYDHITVRHLLTHTSGLPSYEDQFEKKWDHKKIAYNKDILAMLAKEKDSLFFPPGSKWKYSNTGFAVLASIIQKVSGMRYNDFMAKNIFRPLGMNHTFIYNSRRSDPKLPVNYALGFVYSDSLHRYILPDSLPELDMVYYLDGIVGDGCVNSTTADLLKWVNALREGRLVPKAAIAEMLSPLVQMSAADSSRFYGFGVGITKDSAHGKIIAHSGGWPGYSTLLNWLTDKDEVIIILSNNGSNSGQMNAALESILWGESLVMPYQHKEVKIDTALLDRYVGKYSAFMTLAFTKKDGKLFRHREGTPDIELKPESETKFFYGDGTDRQIEFEVDSTGTVQKTWFINTGQKGEMKRVNN